MDSLTSRKPTGPNSTGAYHLNQPKQRQTTTARPSGDARVPLQQPGTTQFDPSKPSFQPGHSLESFVGPPRESITPEMRRIKELEDAMLTYNYSHSHEMIGFQKKADETQVQADQTQAQANRIQSQAEKTSFQLEGLQQVLRKDFRTIGLQIHSGSSEVRELTVRLEAADRERSWMAAHMRTKTLAEAESHELMARRLRESVLGPDGFGQLQGGVARLQLTADPSHQQRSGALESPTCAQEPVELDASTEVTVRGEETVGLETKTEVAEDGNKNTSSKWRPHAISQLTPLKISPNNQETFTWEEIYRYLGGAQYSPGLYLANNESESSILKGKTYWLLEAQYEPFAPTQPGQHGAKLTAFFNDTPTDDGLLPEEAGYSDVPLFICLKEGKGYTYLGTYSQKRYSDKLSHSELFQHVPQHILKYWAAQLADHRRPAWVTEQLIAHFWPAPIYAGPIPSDEAVTTPFTGVSDPRDPEKVFEKRVVRSLERFAFELKEWKKESQLKVQLLTEEALMEMWSKSDLDEEKGLRPWWEYLECVGFNDEFYEKLVARKQAKGKVVLASKGGQSKSDSTMPQIIKGGKDGKERRDSGVISELELDETPIKEAKFKCTKRQAKTKVISQEDAEPMVGQRISTVPW